MSVSQAGNRRTQGAELIAWAVVKDDNLHRRPKRAPVTLPAACGFRTGPFRSIEGKQGGAAHPGPFLPVSSNKYSRGVLTKHFTFMKIKWSLLK
jgi:hypothetical protein